MCRRADSEKTAHTGDAAVSYSEVKALTAENPLLIDKARAAAELARLEPAERDWHDILPRWGKALHVVRHEHLVTPIVNTVAAVRFCA